MASYSLPHFGNLDTRQLEEYYDVDIEYNGGDLQIDLNFESEQIDPSRLEIAKRFIENVGLFDKQNQEYIRKDFADEQADTVRSYIEHHLEELPLTDNQDENLGPEEHLLNSLHLVRMGLYPDQPGQFAIFDYSIGRELTQYLVVINTDENGQLDYMTMES